MTTNLSFITANFIARELNWSMTQGWGQGAAAVQAWFRPEATFAGRFEALLAPVAAAGFRKVDLWLGHLDPAWATDRQLDDAARVLDRLKLSVTSLAGFVPHQPGLEERVFVFARRLGTDLFAGNWELLKTDRAACARLLRQGGLRLGYENHPEPSAQAVLDVIGTTDTDVLGTAVDTGWYATQGADVLAQMRALKDRIFHVHLKDIFPPHKTPGVPTMKAAGHETCALGRGIVGIPALYRWLKAELPRVPVSIEHEPEDRDPWDDIVEGVRLIEGLDASLDFV